MDPTTAVSCPALESFLLPFNIIDTILYYLRRTEQTFYLNYKISGQHIYNIMQIHTQVYLCT